jgi:molybdate/tungstate transport system substrate-binding protein
MLVCLALVVTSCSSSKSSTPASSSAGAPSSAAVAASSPAASASATGLPQGTGPVDVLSAGSLQDLMQKSVMGNFNSATGYTLVDFSAGSSTLASDIKGKVKQGDVFVSASQATNATLEGAANGNWVSWYATFATSELALGYNPKSKFAADLKTMPWYDVVTMPGFRLGLTPPATDPKGVLAVKALDTTATAQKLPALTALGTNTKNQFPETNLEAEVESGQLDAGFFYLAEANSANIMTVPLTGVDLKANYTITVLNNAPHPDAANAFVLYLLGAGGQADLAKYGFTMVSPVAVSGTGVPAALSSVIPSS